MKYIFFTLLFTIPNLVNALTVDSLFLTSDKNGNGTFEVTNNDQKVVFLSGDITKINVNKMTGEFEKIPLTKDNLPLWGVSMTPAKMVLNPSEKRYVNIKTLCVNNCKRDVDVVYQINFIPHEYNRDADEINNVGMIFGFSPFFVVPANNFIEDYKIIYDSKSGIIDVKNNGNSYINILLERCSQGVKFDKNRKCRISYTVLSGRHKTFKIAEHFRADSLKIKVTNYDNSYVKNMVLD